MMIDRGNFFNTVRKLIFDGTMTQQQVDGCNAILEFWEMDELTLKPYLAYIFATTYHETAATMQPIEEFGKGQNKAYGKPDPETGLTYYGRGFVQLTWKANYIKAGNKIGTDLMRHPERAMEIQYALQILFDGMIEGWFTGKKLSDYFNDRKIDYINARKIINGNDKDLLIAGYAWCFREAID